MTDARRGAAISLHPRPLTGGRRARAATAALTAALLGVATAASAGVAPAEDAAPAAAAAASDPLTVAYVEVNDSDLLNAGRYELADGSNALDVAIIFAANINDDGDGAYLHLNDQVRATLGDADTQIRPLQAKGIRVTLSLLGNHSASGFANFPTPEAAQEFADEVAQVVRTYDLDGVDIDDEWVRYGEDGTPAAVPGSAAWLVEALDESLPQDSLITLYDIGEAAEQLEDAPADVLDRVDYFWNHYYGEYNVPQHAGVGPERLGAAAVDLTQTPVDLARLLAARTVEDGYGVFVTYNLQAGDTSEYLSAVTQELDGQDTVLVDAPDPVQAEQVFTDVPAGSQFFSEIGWAFRSGISQGWKLADSSREFRPTAPIARDAMAAFLHREAGSPAFDPPAVSPFADVAPGDPFYAEITWLEHEGISTGWTEPDGTRTFRPLEPIARDAMAAFLHRAAGSPEVSAPATSPFQDVSPTDMFYAEMSWLASEGIATGWQGNDGTSLYRPLSTVGRDAMAAFLHRFHHGIA